ncbi:hypothetical protein LTS17_010016 [Exophiala oligosperma]
MAYNCAVQNLKTWPARCIIDLLQYSCELALPSEIQASLRLEQLKHQFDAMALQAVLYVGQARSSSTSWTIEDIPKTSYLSKSPPSQGDIKKLLYRNGFDRFLKMQLKMQELPRGEAGTAEDTMRKVISIAPLAFEALLFMTATDPAASHHDLSLPSLLDQIIELQPPRNTYSCMADMILSAACPCSVADAEGTAVAAVPLPTSRVTQLLIKLIEGISNQPDYDISQASRWIRCVVQVVVDRHGDEVRIPGTEEETGLTTVHAVVEQALSLARSVVPPCSSTSQHKRATVQAPPGRQAYPTEELEWLATTLFNLSIDLYVSTADAEGDDGNVDLEGKHESARGQHAGDDDDDGEYFVDYKRPRFWARKAVEVADLLSGHDGQPNGDGGMLSRLLRERCQSIGWDV